MYERAPNLSSEMALVRETKTMCHIACHLLENKKKAPNYEPVALSESSKQRCSLLQMQHQRHFLSDTMKNYSNMASQKENDNFLATKPKDMEYCI